MKEQSKLKKGQSYLWALIMGILGGVYLISTIIEGETYGTDYTSMVYGVVLIAFCAILFLRFRYSAFAEGLLLLIGGIMVGTLTWHYHFARHTDIAAPWETTLNIHRITLIVYIFISIPIILLRRKKVQWHHRQIFEVAARPVDDTADGFTSRPYPLGKIEYSRDEIVGFAKYLGRKLIAVPRIEADGVILNFSARMANLGKPNLQEASYVSFGFDGNVSVNMARKDYEQYRNEFTFDRLCESLGGLFKRFLGYYQDGKSEKIVEILSDDSARIKKYFLMGSVVLLFVLFIITTLIWFFMSRR